jgi:hypothetical protein
LGDCAPAFLPSFFNEPVQQGFFAEHVALDRALADAERPSDFSQPVP